MSDAAIATIVTGIVTLAGMIFGYLKLREEQRQAARKAEEIRKDTSYIATKTDTASDRVNIIEKKLDINTKITVKGNDEAVKTAAVAATAATSAAVHTEAINKKLNGGIDSAISEGLAPFKKALDEHAEKDDQNMKTITKRLDELEKYVHERNHQNDAVFQAISAKLGAILIALGVEKSA